MTENKSSLKLDIVPEQVREALVLFTEKLNAALGDNLQSITVVGSSLTRDYRPGQSDINTVLVLGKLTVNSLDAIAGMAKVMSRKKISAPLLMTLAYIERSLDVFGVEFLDFQLIHQTILGSDPFVLLNPKKDDVRLQCERELKAMLIRLRQGYIAAAADRKIVRDILISTEKGLAPLLRAMLWLKSIDRPAETEPTFKKAGAEFSINVESLIYIAGWQYEKVYPDKTTVKNSFESVYSIVEKLAIIVDELEA
ncbi:MAG: hypothetical protein A2167_05560 [Planctomycetes bacterium RBG_13_46_10]|nr:MAG: hypothetical protein A2167_05560 [Planctomycetes bacterium RBG_13_46_10]